jgi:glycosyltransferase A (GT-A) superfamily protein (DUF2064 family)
MTTLTQHRPTQRFESAGSGSVHLLVVAKEPVPGKVKTRLCPPATPTQAATIAAAALADTITAASLMPAERRTLLVDGTIVPPAGWSVVPQRGGPLGERLAAGFADAEYADTTSLLIGMDTPQVTAAVLDVIAAPLTADDSLDAVLGPAEDGGWWCLALRSARHATALRDVPMSQPDTAAMTLAALRSAGATVAIGPTLRDVDTAADAWAVAETCDPASRFARAVRDQLRRRVDA